MMSVTRYDLCLLCLLHSREGRKGGGGAVIGYWFMRVQRG